MEADDPTLVENLARLKGQRSAAEVEVRLLTAQKDSADRRITPKRLARFANIMPKALNSGDPAFRRAYLQLFVDTVVVSDREIAISGSTLALAKGANSGENNLSPERVPSFVREWRPVGDSNPCYRRERAVS